ncbi:MAG: RNA polymerase sigma factor [Methylotetracoccus sp.]
MSSRDADDLDDLELLRKICAADHQAFEQLYKRYYQRLFRFAYRVLRRLESIEEIINDVMYVVWRRAASFNPQGRVSTWIFGIAYRKCLKASVSGNSSEHVPLDDAEDTMPAQIDGGLRDLEIEDWLSVAFSKLPADQRAVLELTYHQGLHYGEIAEIMQCPENTVKTRMFHARRKIKALFPDLIEDMRQVARGKSL